VDTIFTEDAAPEQWSHQNSIERALERAVDEDRFEPSKQWELSPENRQY
jgi:hypothetical protein